MIKVIIKICKFFRSHVKKNQLIMFGMGLVLIMVGIVSWNVYFSKVYIFNKQEDKLLKTVENYYLYHKHYLPSKGMIKTLTLEELYKMKQIDTIFQPKSSKFCDTNSWVKVYNDGKKYHYYVYLKCGKFETKVDHVGPEITLNGDNIVYVSLGKTYDEAGVKSVIDDVDGKIDISKVVIDNSKVNTKKVGTYKITYAARDKLNNETKVERKVIVVRNLTDIVKDNTNDTNYYQGDINNNYLLFSGMMYRIINVNDDGSVRIISNQNLNNLRFNTDNYENSNVDTYLNKEYLKIIHDDSYLVDTEFCVGSIESRDNTSNACSQKITRKVGILSYQEFTNTLKDGKGYLCGQYNHALANKISGSILVSGGSDNCTSVISSDTLPSIRPVLTLKSDLIILSGDGTSKNPYKLDDYSYARQQDKINTRLVGEYVNYSGILFRIIDTDSNNNIKLISTDSFKIGNLNKYLLFSVPEVDSYRFNTKSENNPGYILNNNFIDYINDSSLVKTKYEVPINVLGKKYNELENDGKGEAKIILPRTYDLFSGVQTNNGSGMYLYLDASNKNNNIYYINPINGRVFEDKANVFGQYASKIIVTIKGDLLIRSGKGTLVSPYYVK